MAIAHPRDRRWRYEDLFELPDDGRRWEIIDGELFEMPAPGWEHAVTIMNLLLLLGPIVRGMGGVIVTAPVDVFLPGGGPIEPDVVEPDIIVLLEERVALPTRRGVEGPPTLLIEVVSPSNPGHDRLRKRALYARAGVLEYWLVDPRPGVAEVLALDGDEFRQHCRATGEEVVTSVQLASLRFPASAAFA